MEDRPDLGYTQPQPPPDEMFTRRTHRPPVPETGARSRPRLTLQSALVGVVAGGIIISAVGCLLAASAYTYYQARGTILPGVGVGDLSLDGMTDEEAAAALDERFNQQGEIVITAGGQSWTASPAEFGLSLDAYATARLAADVGRGGGVIDEALDLAYSVVTRWDVPPVVTLDQDAARAGLEQWSATINAAPQDAALRLEDGQVIAVPGVAGYTLNVEATLTLLAADPSRVLLEGYLPLALDPVAPRLADASPALGEAQALLAGPLDVIIYDPITDEQITASAPPEEIAEWLSVSQLDDGSVQVVVDEGRVTAFLDALDNSLGEGRGLDPARNAPTLTDALHAHETALLVVSHDPTSYTVQPGDSLIAISWQVGIPYWKILEANPGLQADHLEVGQVLAIPSVDEMIPLPPVIGKRLLLDISDQRLRAYQDGEVLYEFVISTGIDRSPTQPGVFQVQLHDPSAYASVWDLTMPNFLGIYEAWPGFYNGFHGLPTQIGRHRV